MRKRKKYSGEQKAIILRELLENNIQVSQLAEKYGVNPIDIYNWKKKLFEGANEILTSKPGRKGKLNNETKKISSLEEKLKKRDEAISYLLRENIELKKNINGDD
ncbi:MAG TPA: transposase [Candidatus Portnoybacteria bacterium]|nr:transposase [Candidatus Portnoybacteria bacterium]